MKLVKKPILGGLYNKVSFEVIPTHVEIGTDFENVQFTFNNDKTELDDKKSVFIGEFLPGEYKWSAILKAELGDIPFKGEMEVGRHALSNEEVINLEIEPKYATITTNSYDATLLVNGKQTESNFYGENKIGPLPLNGSVKVQAEVTDNGKKYKTDIVKVKKENIKLNFKYLIDQDAKEAATEALEKLVDENSSSIESFYKDFRKAYESDVNNHIYNSVSNYVVDGSKLDKEYASYFKDFTGDDEIDNHTNYLSDLEAIDETTYKFNTEEDYTFYSHKKVRIEYSFKKTYTIIKSGNSYKISAIDSKKVSQEESEYDND